MRRCAHGCPLCLFVDLTAPHNCAADVWDRTELVCSFLGRGIFVSTSIKSVSAIQIQNVISKVFSELTGDECMVVICEMRFEASAMQDFAGGETF